MKQETSKQPPFLDAASPQISLSYPHNTQTLASNICFLRHTDIAWFQSTHPKTVLPFFLPLTPEDKQEYHKQQ